MSREEDARVEEALSAAAGCQMSLARADASDGAAIRDLTREAYAKWVSLIGREPLPMMVDYAEAAIAHRIDLVRRQEILAAVMETTAAGDRLLIVNLAVRPSFQGRGLAGALLGHADRLALGAGLVGTRLYTNALFAENVSLYLAKGYLVERTELTPLGDVVHMVKTLKEREAI